MYEPNQPNVSKPNPPSQFKISPEDQKVIDECNRESFFKRCLPLASTFGGTTYLAVKSGYLNPHAKFGATPKVMAAVFLGYFLGKFSYQQVCIEKLMAIPNSPLGAMLRAKRERGGGGVFQDSMTMEMPGYSMPDENYVDKYRDDIGPRTFTDLDTDRPYNKGLDDSFRVNIDSPQRTEDFILPPQASTPNSYDEMRRKNREEFERRSRERLDEQHRQYQPPQPPPSSTSGPEPFDRYRPTNSYGDIFEK